MKNRPQIKLPEILYLFSYLLFLAGNQITLIEHGIELSLWLMTFAAVLSTAITVLPWFGFQWLRLDERGCRWGRPLAIFIQLLTMGAFAAAMFYRLMRELPRFYYLITLTALLWTGWLLIFIYSRHTCTNSDSDDKLRS